MHIFSHFKSQRTPGWVKAKRIRTLNTAEILRHHKAGATDDFAKVKTWKRIGQTDWNTQFTHFQCIYIKIIDSLSTGSNFKSTSCGERGNLAWHSKWCRKSEGGTCGVLCLFRKRGTVDESSLFYDLDISDSDLCNVDMDVVTYDDVLRSSAFLQLNNLSKSDRNFRPEMT